MLNPLSLVPTVIDRGTRGERAYDIYSLLLKERIIFLGSAINAQVANLIVAQLLYLDAEDPEREIRLYINSPGGEMYAGFAMYDAMQQISAPVSTAAVGITASFGTVMLAGGAAGRRFALKNATIHMHQPHGGAQGQASDIAIQAAESLRLKTLMQDVFMKHTGQSRERIEQDLDRDIYLSAEQALEYGLIDGVVDAMPHAQPHAQ